MTAYYFLINNRGFPVWLKYVPGISFRTDNEPFKVYRNFVNNSTSNLPNLDDHLLISNNNKVLFLLI